jgi:hypothetical protein
MNPSVALYSSVQQVEVAWRCWGSPLATPIAARRFKAVIAPRPEASGHLLGEDITLGARAHGGLEGAAYRRVRSGAADDREWQDPLAPAPGRQEAPHRDERLRLGMRVRAPTEQSPDRAGPRRRLLTAIDREVALRNRIDSIILSLENAQEVWARARAAGRNHAYG